MAFNFYEPGSAAAGEDAAKTPSIETHTLDSYQSLVQALTDGINGHEGTPYNVVVSMDDGTEKTITVGSEPLSDQDLRLMGTDIVQSFDDVTSLTPDQRQRLSSLEEAMLAGNATRASIGDELAALTASAPAAQPSQTPQQAQTPRVPSQTDLNTMVANRTAFEVTIAGKPSHIISETGEPFTQAQQQAITNYVTGLSSPDTHQQWMAASARPSVNFDLVVPDQQNELRRLADMQELANAQGVLDNHRREQLADGMRAQTELQNNPGLQFLMALARAFFGADENEQAQQQAVQDELAPVIPADQRVTLSDVQNPEMFNGQERLSILLNHENIIGLDGQPITNEARRELLEQELRSGVTTGMENEAGYDAIAVAQSLRTVQREIAEGNTALDGADAEALIATINDIATEPNRDALTQATHLSVTRDNDEVTLEWQVGGRAYKLEISEEDYTNLSDHQKERLGEIAVSLSLPNKDGARIDDIAAMIADAELNDVDIKFRNPGMGFNDVQGTLEEVIRGFDDEIDGKSSLRANQLGDSTERLAITAATGNDPMIRFESEQPLTREELDAVRTIGTLTILKGDDELAPTNQAQILAARRELLDADITFTYHGTEYTDIDTFLAANNVLPAHMIADLGVDTAAAPAVAWVGGFSSNLEDELASDLAVFVGEPDLRNAPAWAPEEGNALYDALREVQGALELPQTGALDQATFDALNAEGALASVREKLEVEGEITPNTTALQNTIQGMEENIEKAETLLNDITSALGTEGDQLGTNYTINGEAVDFSSVQVKNEAGEVIGYDLDGDNKVDENVTKDEAIATVLLEDLAASFQLSDEQQAAIEAMKGAFMGVGEQGVDTEEVGRVTGGISAAVNQDKTAMGM